jgi:hypothetical protein
MDDATRAPDLRPLPRGIRTVLISDGAVTGHERLREAVDRVPVPRDSTHEILR